MKRFLLSLLTLFVMVLCTFAQNNGQAEIIRKINATATSMKTMQADFVQTKHVKMLGDKLVSRGRMYYRQADRLRWEYTTPYAYTFVLNGQRVLLRKGQRSDVMDTKQNKMFREIARLMMNTVTGQSLTSGKDFKVSIATSGSEWLATLTPQRKEMKQMFQRIMLHFSKTTSMISIIELTERNGDRTVIQLKNVQKNKAINAKNFEI